MRNLEIDYTPELSFGVELDCISEVAATTVAMDNGFTAVHAAPPTITSPDAFGGRWLCTHTAVANQVMQIGSTNEIFQFVEGLPIRFHGRVLPGPTTPEQENIFLGCVNDIFGGGAAVLQDAGAGMRATGDGFGFYSPETGGAVWGAVECDHWIAYSTHNTVQQYTVLDAANSLDGVAHRVCAAGPGAGIEADLVAEWVPTNFVPGVAGAAPTIFDAEVRFWINGILVAKHIMAGNEQITTANTTLMNFGLCLQNTAAATTFILSRMGCRQLYDGRE